MNFSERTHHEASHTLRTRTCSQDLQKGEGYLEEGRCDYICTALRWTLPHGVLEDSEDHKAYRPAKSIVMERLEGRNSLESWLKKQGFFPHKRVTPELEQKLRNHRLQWLDLLIAEFEGEKP